MRNTGHRSEGVSVAYIMVARSGGKTITETLDSYLSVLRKMKEWSVYLPRSAIITVGKDGDPDWIANWDWYKRCFVIERGEEVKNYFDLYESAVVDGVDVWIHVKRYQKQDAMMKFLDIRKRETFIVESTSPHIPADFVGGLVTNVYLAAGAIAEQDMPSLPVYKRGHLIGWDEARIQKLVDGWTAPTGKDAIQWATVVIIDDLEREILELREELRKYTHTIRVPVVRNSDEFAF